MHIVSNLPITRICSVLGTPLISIITEPKIGRQVFEECSKLYPDSPLLHNCIAVWKNVSRDAIRNATSVGGMLMLKELIPESCWLIWENELRAKARALAEEIAKSDVRGPDRWNKFNGLIRRLDSAEQPSAANQVIDVWSRDFVPSLPEQPTDTESATPSTEAAPDAPEMPPDFGTNENPEDPT
jgi:hypothetical protein